MKIIAGIELHSKVLAVAKDEPLYISKVKEWLDYNNAMRKHYSSLARKNHKEL